MKQEKKDEAEAMALFSPPPPDHTSISIISSLRRAEFNMHVKQQAWRKVKELLEIDPDVARAADPTTGEYPLHVLARNPRTEPLLVDITLLKYPQALMHPDLKGALPLHAAATGGNIDVLKIIFMAYQDAKVTYDGMGRYVQSNSRRAVFVCQILSFVFVSYSLRLTLIPPPPPSLPHKHSILRYPIHVAAESNEVKAIRFLLDEDPASFASVVQKPKRAHASLFMGGLPIHCACRVSASAEIIEILIANNTASAKVKDYMGNLPLHLLLRYGTTVDIGTIKRLHSAYQSSLKRKDSNGDTPLIIALKHGTKSDIASFILRSHPEAAREESGDKRFPLIIALENGFDDDLIMQLIEHAPTSVTKIDGTTGLLPIEVATNEQRSQKTVHYLLMQDLPVDVNDTSPNTIRDVAATQHSWEHIVAIDDYCPVVANLLKACTHSQVS